MTEICWKNYPSDTKAKRQPFGTFCVAQVANPDQNYDKFSRFNDNLIDECYFHKISNMLPPQNIHQS